MALLGPTGPLRQCRLLVEASVICAMWLPIEIHKFTACDPPEGRDASVPSRGD